LSTSHGSTNSTTDASLRESRIPVSSAFFSNLYGSHEKERLDLPERPPPQQQQRTNEDRGRAEVPISDSSLAAGWEQHHSNDDSVRSGSDGGTGSVGGSRHHHAPKSPSSTQLRHQLLQSSVSGGFIDRLEAAVRESSPSPKKQSQQQANQARPTQPNQANQPPPQAPQAPQAQQTQQQLRRQKALQQQIIALENELTRDILSQRELEDAVDSVRVEVSVLFFLFFLLF
jgi:hypothetical protein